METKIFELNKPKPSKQEKLIIKKQMKFQSKYLNTTKKSNIENTFDYVKNLKNEMSEFIYKHIGEQNLYPHGSFSQNYKQWNDNTKLYSHTLQTLFQDVLNFYINMINQHINNQIQKIKDNLRDKQYTSENKQKIKLMNTILEKSYLTFVDRNNIQDFLSKQTLKIWDNLTEKEQEQILFEVDLIRLKILDKLNKITFKSGSFRLTSSSGYSFDILYDKDNKLFKYFLEIYLNKNLIVRVPLLINKKYHKKFLNSLNRNIFDKQLWLIDKRYEKNTSRIRFQMTYNSEMFFDEFQDIVGVDINLNSYRFIQFSNGDTIQYDEKLFKKLLDYIEIIDKQGYQNLSKNQIKKLKKLIKTFSWRIEYDIQRYLDNLKQQGVTDIIMEDLFLNGKSNKNFKIEILGYKFKFNRFIRLLHLSDIKNIFKRVQNNKGLRVHLTNPQYTSQQCPVCGHIHKNNRKDQKHFKCEKCGYKMNQDVNQQQNILQRFLNPIYRKKLHKKDKTGELISKHLTQGTIKNVLTQGFEHVGNVFLLSSKLSGLHRSVNPSTKNIKFIINYINCG